MTKYCFFYLGCIWLGACSHSIHMSQFSGFNGKNLKLHYQKSTHVSVETSQNVLLGLVFNSQFVDDAYVLLSSQCPNQVVAINTQYATEHYFLYWVNKITLRALCVI